MDDETLIQAMNEQATQLKNLVVKNDLVKAAVHVKVLNLLLRQFSLPVDKRWSMNSIVRKAQKA